ncbi:MAG: efflux RND transporter permease subunit [Desulfobacterales bacterium]|nr:efflux RND transporter permease subunit [Desulfobacterales bacterium]
MARVQIGGGLEYSMRIWVDSNQLAARNLTITDVENALRSENIELPAGNVESRTRDFRVRIQRGYRTVADFENLVLTRSADGYLVRLRDVARVETGPAERRNMLRGNGVPMVGIGIVKQSKANTLAVAKLAKAEAAAINKDLPEGMRILQSYDSSVFIESAIDGVYMALFEAVRAGRAGHISHSGKLPRYAGAGGSRSGFLGGHIHRAARLRIYHKPTDPPGVGFSDRTGRRRRGGHLGKHLPPHSDGGGLAGRRLQGHPRAWFCRYRLDRRAPGGVCAHHLSRRGRGTALFRIRRSHFGGGVFFELRIAFALAHGRLQGVDRRRRPRSLPPRGRSRIRSPEPFLRAHARGQPWARHG